MPLEPPHQVNRPPAALTGTDPHGRGTAVNNNKPRVVVHVNTDWLLAFLTVCVSLLLVGFLGAASFAANNTVEALTADGSQGYNTPLVTPSA